MHKARLDYQQVCNVIYSLPLEMDPYLDTPHMRRVVIKVLEGATGNQVQLGIPKQTLETSVPCAQ